MKKRNYYIVCLMTYFICFSSTTSTAQTAKDVFDSDFPITYLGIDFSNARCYGEGARFDAADITQRINDVARNEYEKYNLADAIKKNKLDIKFELTEKLNSKIDDDKFFTYNESDLNKLDEADIQKIVSKYNFTGYDNGLAVVFIVDNLNKSKTEEVAWITFINIGSKKVIFTEKVVAKAGGFGLRNYWAKPFYTYIKDIKSTLFKKWKSKYGS